MQGIEHIIGTLAFSLGVVLVLEQIRGMPQSRRLLASAGFGVAFYALLVLIRS